MADEKEEPGENVANEEEQQEEGLSSSQGHGRPEPDYSIEGLSKLDDESLHHALGHKKELETVRKGLQEAQGLTGKAREHAEGKIHEMFTPKIYPGDFKYLAEDSKRHVKRTAQEALNDTSPASVV